MTERDADIEFEFFEDAATEETVRAERVRRRGPRPPVRPPTGVTPLLRLVGLVAFAILIVVLLVFWVQSCLAEGKRNEYESYMGTVAEIAAGSQQIGRELNDLLTTPGIKQADLESELGSLAQRQQQYVARAQELDPPGRLRLQQRHLIEALEFRVSGLRGLEDAFRRTARSRDAPAAGDLLAGQAQRLVASDVIWDDLFMDPAVEELKAQELGGIEVPDSNFLQNPDLASTRSLIPIWQRIRGAAVGGTPTGLHGTGIVSVRALPGGQELSTQTDNTVRAGTDLAFAVTIKDTGDAQEVQIPVTLTIQQSPTPIVKRAKIDLINPNETRTLVFRDLGQVQFATKTTLKVDVQPVPGEKNLANNSIEYSVIFSLG